MRNYTSSAYKDLVEETGNKMLQTYMQAEYSFLKEIREAKIKSAVDLGAGYGRIIPFLSERFHIVVAIEINPDMYKGLEQRAARYSNVQTILGSIMDLPTILTVDTKNPIFLILQNSLGVLEGATHQRALRTVIKEARKRNGQIILSLFRQPALQKQGLPMYASLESMVGRIDLAKSDIKRGLFVTNTGYVSKWWTDVEIAGLEKLGRVARKSCSDAWVLLQIDFLQEPTA